jgi:anionic cell wall polymer biosynthesis LytR-Cps2A-Psr (LCP) family protein/TM2 domain-containing membrane protein YozV
MSSNPSPAVAAILSFLFPGAGQVYAGQTRKGLVWALPMFLFVLGVIWIIIGGQNRILTFVKYESLLGLLVLNLAFFLYHLAAMLDAYSIAQRERSRGLYGGAGAPILLAALVSLTLVLHGVPEVVGYQATSSFCNIFHCNQTPGPGVIPPASFSTLPPVTPGLRTPTPLPTPTAVATPTQSSGSPGATGSPGTQTPAPTRSPLPPIDIGGQWPAWAQDDRLNVLVVGTDSRSDTGIDEDSIRTDTMLLMSVDIEAGKAAFFSFPRNMCSAAQSSCDPGTRYPDWLKLPLAPEVMANPAAQAAFPDGSFGGLPQPGYNYLNALWRYAAIHPEIFPGSDGVSAQDCQVQFTCERAWRALVGTIQEMTAVQIDGVVAVNLKGFVSLVANLPPQCPSSDVRVALVSDQCYGGVWIDVPDPVHDDVYHTSQQQQIVVDIQKGCQFFDGEMTLAYSRSRHETSDYDRARRQQYVLTQIRKQLDPLAMLPHIPALLGVAQENLFLTWQDTDIQWLAQAASRIDADRIYRYDFAPSKLNDLGSMQAIRDKVNGIFDEPEPEPDVKPNAPPCPPKD